MITSLVAGLREEDINILEKTFRIASATTPGEESIHEFITTNSEAFPNSWKSMLGQESVLNDQTIMGKFHRVIFHSNADKCLGHVLNVILDCSTNSKSSLEKIKSCNGFAVKCLSLLPLETLRRRDRELIMLSWDAKKLVEVRSDKGLAWVMPCLSPAVLSLKARIMRLPTFYDNFKFQDLVDLATLIEESVQDPRVTVPIFTELSKRVLGHVLSSLDQKRSQEYLSDATKWFDTYSKRRSSFLSSGPPGYASVKLSEIVWKSLSARILSLEEAAILKSADLILWKLGYELVLFADVQRILDSDSRLSYLQEAFINSAFDAFDSMGLTASDVSASITGLEKEISAMRHSYSSSLTRRLQAFIWADAPEPAKISRGLTSKITSDSGRLSIQKTISAVGVNLDQAGKHDLVSTLLEDALNDHTQLNKLLALRHDVLMCEDTRETDNDDTESTSNTLSPFYSQLTEVLSKSAGVRQFCLVSEIMTLILRTKPRAITQWNIDSTLSSITIMCSRSGPSLSPRSAGAIFLHLCHLLQTILTSHRLKLQGHFHLLVQTMQALLRCLFTPLPHSSAKIAALHPQPPWLSAFHPLGAKHAAAYTRLLTLICDPSVSSVRQGKNALVSATDKAKRMAGQYMPVVLSSYIRLQLEMKMSSECRERLVQGLYAIFDTTTLESRRVLGESLDSSGRAVLGGLVRDYLRFGKWTGS